MSEMSQPNAKIWRRALAGGIDFCLVPAFALLLMLVTGLLESAEAYTGGFPYLRVFFLGVTSYLILNGWLLWQRGQTLGQHWLKLKIVNSQDGENPGLVETDFSPCPVLWFTPCSVDRFLVSGANRLGVSIWQRQMLFA